IAPGISSRRHTGGFAPYKLTLTRCNVTGSSGTRRAFQTRARRATHSGIPRPDPNDPQNLTVAPMVVTPGRDGVLWDAGSGVTGKGTVAARSALRRAAVTVTFPRTCPS